MKIISWNLKNVSANKLNNVFQPKFQANGLGNNVLDYVINVVMGATPWAGVVSQTPADLFVIIELKTGGDAKGSAISGKCEPTLKLIVDAMNAYVKLNGLGATNYTYDATIPLVTGYHETVGFVYNTQVLTSLSTAVERNSVTGYYLLPRTPLVATFDIVARPGSKCRFSGIHDAPPSGAEDVRMRPPIDFCNLLVNTPSAKIPDTCFLGDFNCQPSDSYTKADKTVVHPFTGLNISPLGYSTALAPDSLSSTRQSIDSEEMGQAAYLSAAYDNAIFWMPGTTPTAEYVPDLIGRAKNVNVIPNADLYPAKQVSLLNAYHKVSDHLPVIMEF